MADPIRDALNNILEANDSFRAGMPADWEGDLLQDACSAARAALAATPAVDGLANLMALVERAMDEWERDKEASDTTSCAQHIAITINAALAATPESSNALTGAALGRWCYENPNLAALTIEGLRAATPGGEALTLEQIEDILCKAFCDLDEDQKVHNGYVMAGAQAILAAQPPLRGRKIDEMREFQRWVVDHLMPSEFSHSYLFEVDEDGDYVRDFVSEFWDGWQARAALAQPPEQPAADPVGREALLAAQSALNNPINMNLRDRAFRAINLALSGVPDKQPLDGEVGV